MAEFKVIETQEQLDEVIKKALRDRVEQAEKKVREQYADYDKIKETATKADERIKELTAELEKKQVTIDSNQSVVDELNAKIKGMELSSVKTSVALEKGLPYQMAERLTGQTKEEITADADAMVKLIGSTKKAPPLGSNDPAKGGNTDPAASAYKALLTNLSQGE